ncbi:MAG: hypothetical protein WCN81_13010, partial [Actinomycetes bacterium]
PLDRLLIMTHLVRRGGLIVHSAGLVMDGAGLAFLGVSGAGKTTLSELLVAAGLGDGVLSDDRTIVRTGDASRHTVWGTPWPGDAGIARNLGAPLGALYFLRQEQRNEIVALTPSAAVERLFPVISCPWYDRGLTTAVLDTCERLVADVPCYEFRFARDQGAVEALRRHAATLS